MRGETGYTFVCPACGEGLEVNWPMRRTLLEKGCVLCGAIVRERDFT